ncbi:hypothetical protein PFISCL1PPCAC_3661, partial [Pristionchus fissidentatus]
MAELGQIEMDASRVEVIALAAVHLNVLDPGRKEPIDIRDDDGEVMYIIFGHPHSSMCDGL